MTPPAAPLDEAYFVDRILQFNDGPKGRAELGAVAERLAARGVRGTVLDLGCGPGRNAARLGELDGLRVVGADLSPVALALAGPGGVPHRVRLDASRLAFRSESFAGVVMTHVLGHLPAPRRALEEVRRVLRPGGLVCLVTPNRAFVDIHRVFNERGLLPYDRDPSVRRYYDAAELAHELRAAGLEPLEIEPFGDSPRLGPELVAADLLPAGLELDAPEHRERLIAVASSPSRGRGTTRRG